MHLQGAVAEDTVSATGIDAYVADEYPVAYYAVLGTP